MEQLISKDTTVEHFLQNFGCVWRVERDTDRELGVTIANLVCSQLTHQPLAFRWDRKSVSQNLLFNNSALEMKLWKTVFHGRLVCLPVCLSPLPSHSQGTWTTSPLTYPGRQHSAQKAALASKASPTEAPTTPAQREAPLSDNGTVMASALPPLSY